MKEKLREIGLVSDEPNRNSNNISLIKGVIARALYPNVHQLVIDRKKGFPFINKKGIDSDERYYLAQRSVNHVKDRIGAHNEFLAFFEAKKGGPKGNIHIQDSTVLNEFIARVFTPLGLQGSQGKLLFVGLST